ncbi:PadR family transcriptional regulator [Candidatus Bathyarchaeota archaeon]|nr:PadR family transcriptional regulator [Candidatus Bathyarchaeota archaeon]
MTRNDSSEVMKEQLKRGYLKLAILYTLLSGPAHGYEMIKRINRSTLGLLSPSAGSLYPSLRELEKDGFIVGEWRGDKRRVKVYTITEKGKEVFKEVIEKHFSLASAIRKWLFENIAPLHTVGDYEASPEIIQRALKIILLGEKATPKEKIEFLKDFRASLKRISDLINNLISNIDGRIRELEVELGKGGRKDYNQPSK